MSSRSRIAAAASTATAPSSSSSTSSIFFLKCGCSDANSLSVSIPRSRRSRNGTDDHPADASSSSSVRHHRHHGPSPRFESSSGDTITTAATSTSHDEEQVIDDGDGSPSFSGLLRELSELERSVIACDPRHQIPSGWPYSNGAGETREGEDMYRPSVLDAAVNKAGGGKPTDDNRQYWRQKHRFHRRSQSEGGYGRVGAGTEDVVGMMGRSVIVVTETDDPLGEFRRSMLQMIVEEDIVCPRKLQDLLRRFMELNSPSHHGLIIRAFTDIWQDVFSGSLDDFSAVILPASVQPRRHQRHQYSYHEHHRQ